MQFKIRTTTGADVGALRTLASACPPLGLHTAFTFWVVTHFYGNYSYIAFDLQDKPAGYIMCITKRDEPDLLYVWQIGVLPEYRKQKLAQQLIEALYKEQLESSDIKRMQITIDPLNLASNAFFQDFARRHSFTINAVGEASISDPIEGKSEKETLLEISLTPAR